MAEEKQSGVIETNNKTNTKIEPIDGLTRRFSLYGFALCAAILTLLIVIFIRFYRYITIPILTYFISVIFGIITQLIVCGKLQIGQIFTLSVLLPIFTFIGIGISNIKFMRYPVEALMPYSSPEFKMNIAKGFYSFWGALYAQIIAGGFLQVCPTKV
jgi:hypothetical protein